MIRGDLGAEVGRLGRYPRLRQTDCDCECERRQLWGERQDKLMVDASMQLQNQQEEDKLIVRREEGRRKKLELRLVNIKMAVGLIYVVSRAVLCQKELDKKYPCSDK